MYKVAKWGARNVQGIYMGCKISTRHPKGVQGICQAVKRGARHVKGS